MTNKILPVMTAVLLLAGCGQGNLFYGNAFDGIDEPTTLPGNLDGESAGSLVDLAADWGDHFYDNIDSEEEYDAVTATLENVIFDPNASDSDVQEAAIVLATINLYGSGASDSLDQATQNIVTDGDSLDLSDPVGLADFMFGADATAEEIAPQLAGMMAAYTALDAYGDTLETTPPPVGTDTNLLAMQALTSAVMTTLLTDVTIGLMTADPLLDPETAFEQAVFITADYLANQTGGIEPWTVTFNFLDFTDTTTDGEMNTVLAANFAPGIANVITGSSVADLLRQ
jgi:hypothetical protein